MKLPMNPLGAAIIAACSGGGMFLLLTTLSGGEHLGSAIAGSVVAMLTFGILIVDDNSPDM